MKLIRNILSWTWTCSKCHAVNSTVDNRCYHCGKYRGGFNS